MKFPKEFQEEIHLKATPISEGIAIGIVIFFKPEVDRIPDFPISTGEVEGEIARYRQALSSSRYDLKKIQESLTQEGSKDVALIIGTHIQMLDDPLMTTHMETKIRQMLKNTESVFHTFIGEYKESFNSQTTDAFFRQRLSDVKDLSQRVLYKLCNKQRMNLQTLSLNSVIFAKELHPSDTLSSPLSQIIAFVTRDGGGTSHVALIARSKGIPYVTGIDTEVLSKDLEGRIVIVDGLKGLIIINPLEETLDKYQKLKNRLTDHYHELEKDSHLPVETFDGFRIHLYGNIHAIQDIDQVFQYGGEGIGLFRSEYFFMQDSTLLLDEERQYLIYRNLFKKSQRFPFTFRLLDLGGDKGIPYLEELKNEPNPVLGCRGIRFLLRRPDILKVQLRALYRAALGYPIKLLIPLISDIEEFREVKKFISSIQKELLKEHLSFNTQIPIGCMLEVPSAVLICDKLAQESDFLALGTNDLIQYTLGVDRGNPGMSDFYYPTHPGIIRMIKMTTLEAKRFQKSIMVCGEMASNPLFIPLLIGLGVENLSCASRFIPMIKRTIRHLSLIDCYEIAQHVLSLTTSAEIAGYLYDCIKENSLPYE